MHAARDKLAYTPPEIHKGLANLVGENNCFLNVTIQALWHLGPFRVEIQKFIGHIERGKSNKQRLTPGGLLECICNLFVQYEFTDQKVLPPNELRESLTHLSGKYALGEIADATEAFDTILNRIHTEQSASCPHMKKCLSHKVFGGLVMEQTICMECQANTEPTLRSDFMSCFQAHELINEAKELLRARTVSTSPHSDSKSDMKDHRRTTNFSRLFISANSKSPDTIRSSHSNDDINIQAIGLQANDFGKLLHRTMEVNKKSCPANDEPDRPADQPLCKGKAQVCFFSLEPPLALALSVGWTQAHEDAKTLMDFYCIIQQNIQLNDIFSGQGAQLSSDGPSYSFRGLVCYYGLHYVSIFQEIGTEKFLLFDDQKVRVIGNWDAVKKECVKSKYQPVLLLYELNKSTAYVPTTESDDELELEQSEKAKSGRHKEQKVVLIDLEDTEVESKTGDPFILTPHATPPLHAFTPTPIAPTSASTMLFEQPKADILLPPDSSKEHKSSGPFSAPEKPSPLHHHEEHLSDRHHSEHYHTEQHPPQHHHQGESPHYHSHHEAKTVSSDPYGVIRAVPITISDRHNPSHQYHHTSQPHRNDSSGVASVIGGNTTFHKEMFSPSDDAPMSSMIRPPEIGVSPHKAEDKHYSHPSRDIHGRSPYQSEVAWKHTSGSSNSAGHSIHTHSSGSSGSGVKPSSYLSGLSRTTSQHLIEGLHSSASHAQAKTITKWSHRAMRYNAVLSQESIGTSSKTLGMNILPGNDGRPIVGSFFRHPILFTPLPAEKCGLIQPGDRIVTINDVELREYDIDLIKSMLASADSVTFTMASKAKKNLWYTCPVCTISNIVDQDTEDKIVRYNATKSQSKSAGGAEGYMLKCVLCRSDNICGPIVHD